MTSLQNLHQQKNKSLYKFAKNQDTIQSEESCYLFNFLVKVSEEIAKKAEILTHKTF